VEQVDLKKKLAGDLSLAVRRLKWIFWPVFGAAEAVFLVVQSIYLATEGISVLRFVLNLVIFNVVLSGLMLLIYVAFKRMLLRIYESESKILTIEDISTDAVYTQNMQLEITSWSQGAERIFGYGEEEAIGNSTAILMPDEVPEVDSDMAETVMRDGLVTQRRTVRRRKSGGLFPTEVSVSLLRDPDGQPTGAITVLRDITRQVGMEEELLRTNAELKGYAHVVSHDLKAPLATIRLAADTLDVLTRGPQTADTASQVRQIRETLDRCIDQSAALIGDMLSLAEAGQKPACVSEVDVGAVVGGVLDEMAGYIHDSGTRVSVDQDMGRVAADPTHIHQVFANLISNAIRHNDSSSPEVRVINKGCEGGAVRYVVRDNGSGVAAEDIDKIFVPFYKGESGDTGIGLSTVQKIVGVYGGEIEVYNDGGACFEFVLRGAGASNDDVGDSP
jgi:PAS domain S-box-containing protein